MKKRLLAGFLTLAMLVSLFPIPALAAEGERPEWAVTAFDPLDEGAAFQTVPQGGGEPVLPDTLTAWADRIEDDTTVIVPPEQTAPEGEQTPADSPEEQPDPGEADPAPVEDGGDALTAALVENDPAPAEKQGPDIQQITIPDMIWTAEPEYDHNTPGEYIYTPVLPAAYIVDEGVELPAVTVTVEAAREQTPVERVQALIDALPDPEGVTLDNAEDVAAQIGAIDEASETLSGEELAALDFARYEAVMLALAALMDDTPAFLANGTTHDISIGSLNITADGTYTVTGSTTTNHITVASGVNATIILSGVSIDVSGKNQTSAIDLNSAGACTITLASGTSNILKAGNDRPGVYVPNGNQLTFNGTGTLNVTGGASWPGIGRNGNGNILIESGDITAQGGSNAAGIGGSWGNGGGNITINGGNVTATGGTQGAGIGDGYNMGGTITIISGGSVTANGGYLGAGIGGGRFGAGARSTITITGGSIIAQNNGGSSRAIGQGDGGSGWDNAATKLGGLIIELNDNDKKGQLYSDMTLGRDFTIPEGTTVTIPEGKALTIPANNTLTISNGVTLSNNGTITNNGTIDNNGTFNNNGTINGEGRFPVQISFDTQDGGSVAPASCEVNYGSTYGNLPTPTKSGYTFTGWYTEASGGAKIESSTKVTITAAQTLYAHWTENKSQVAVSFSPSSPAYGSTITITATIAAANSNGLRAAAQNTVTFSMGVETLGTANVSNNKATLQVTLTGEKWKPGEKTITAEFGGSTAYTGSTGTGTLTVQKATPTVTAPTAKTGLTYTGAAQELINTGNTASGCTMQYSLSQNDGYSTNIPQGIEAKTYTVYYKVAGDDYYSDVAAQSVNATISPKAITGTVSITGTPTMGETLTASNSASGETVSYQWYRGNTLISGATGSTYQIVADDVGQTIKVIATGTGNYTGTTTSNPTATVEKATPTITQWPTASASPTGRA